MGSRPFHVGIDEAFEQHLSFFELAFLDEGLCLLSKRVVLAFCGKTLFEFMIFLCPRLRFTYLVLQFEVLFVEEFIQPRKGFGINSLTDNSDMVGLAHRRTAPPCGGLLNRGRVHLEGKEAEHEQPEDHHGCLPSPPWSRSTIRQRRAAPCDESSDDSSK